MGDIYIFLLAGSLALAGLSLVSPRLGIFFAIPEKRHRYHGFIFWLVVTVTLFFIMDILENGWEQSPLVMICAAAFFIISGLLFMYFLIRPVEPFPDKRPGNVIEIRSFSDPNRKFILDLSALSCNCPDWLEWRSEVPYDNPSRLCKHLAAYLGQRPHLLPDELRPYLSFIQERGEEALHPGPPDKQTIKNCGFFGLDGLAIRIGSNSYPWVRFLQKGEMYAFNLDSEEWEDDREPDNAETLLAQVYKVIGNDPNCVSRTNKDTFGRYLK